MDTNFATNLIMLQFAWYVHCGQPLKECLYIPQIFLRKLSSMCMPKWRSLFGTVSSGVRTARTTLKYSSQGTYKENKDGKLTSYAVTLIIGVVFLGNQLMGLLGKTLQLLSKHLTRDTAALNIMWETFSCSHWHSNWTPCIIHITCY